ncbi:MAG: hypothetical protein WAO14_10075, partial [Pseudolabrys sp.]
ERGCRCDMSGGCLEPVTPTTHDLRAKRKSGLIKPPAGDGPPVGSASLRPATGGTNLQPRP